MRQSSRGLRSRVARSAAGAGLIAALLVLLSLAPCAAGASPGSWSTLSIAADGYLNDLCFVDEQHGWLVGGDNTVRCTTDGGANWLVQHPYVGGNGFAAVDFVDARNGWIVGGNGLVAHTSTGGCVWSRQLTPAEYGRGFSGVSFADGLHGVIVGDHGTIVRTVDGGVIWTVEDSGTPAGLCDVAFASPSTAVAVGVGGTLLRTTDGGATWLRVDAGITATLLAVSFVDGSRGWAAGNSGVILSTSDGGATWEPQASGTLEGLYDVCFSTPLVGWAGGDHQTLLKTRDGGATWTAVTGADTPYVIMAAAGAGPDRSWVAGWPGEVSATRDGGTTWHPQVPQPLPEDLNAIDFVDADNGWGIGLQTVYGTSTGGRSWSALLRVASWLCDVAFVDARNGWVVGWDGVILHTDDGGETWAAQDSGTSEQLHAVAFVDDATGWIAGDHGMILHTEDGGATWAAQDSGGSESLNFITFASPDQGWITGGYLILHTSDGGATWTRQDPGTSESLGQVDFTDSANGWIAANASVLHTTDGGATWERLTMPDIRFRGRVVEAIDADTCWAFNGTFYSYRTQDGGLTWQAQTYSDIASSFNDADFVSRDEGWTAGMWKTVFHTRTGGEPDVPVASASGLSGAAGGPWRGPAARIQLAAEPGKGGSPVTRLVYSIDSGPQRTYVEPFPISAAGVHSVRYFAENEVGNLSPVQTGFVRVDAAGPSCAPLNRIAVRRGARAAFRYRLSDPAPSCGLARATIFVYRGQRLVRTFRGGVHPANGAYRLRIAMVLPRGRYIWRVGAVDAVGNVAARSGAMTLRIR